MAENFNKLFGGDADVASAFLNTPSATEDQALPPDPVKEPEKPVEPPKEETKVETPKEPQKPAEPKVEPPKAEHVKEPAKEPVATESDDDIPANPHFDDKPVAEKPEGVDDEKAIKSFQGVKAELKATREARDALKAKVEELEAKREEIETNQLGALKTELDELRTRNAEIERELKAANFKRTPEYLSKVVKPVDEMKGEAKAIAESNSISHEKLWAAIAEPDTKKRADALEELMDGMRSVEKIEVVEMAKRYKAIQDYAQDFEKDAEKILQSEKDKEAQRQQEFIEQERRMQKVYAKQKWQDIEEKYPFLKPVTGADKWNAAIAKAKESLSDLDIDTLDTEKRTDIIARAQIVPFLESAIRNFEKRVATISETKDAKIAELEKQLEAYQAASPNLGREASDTASDDDKEDNGSLSSFSKRIEGR